MRIELNHGTQQVSENNRAGAPNAAVSPSSSAVGEDKTQLSGAHAQVAALIAQASHLPELRDQRVQALRQAVQSGRYPASAEKTAGAILAHMIAVPAR